MKNKCYTLEAKAFENLLSEIGVTYNQCELLLKKWEKLSLEAKAEIRDLLKMYEEDLER